MGKYGEIMEKITVTPEMRARILKNISASADGKKRPARPLSYARKYLSVAACLAVLLAGAVTWQLWKAPVQTPEQQGDAEQGLTSGYGDIVGEEDLNALEQAVGFEVEEITELPFSVTETAYFSYWNELAEITYYGDTESIVFRKAPGQEDISGDYNEYAAETTLDTGTFSVTVKGTADKDYLAVWTDGAYAYSIMAPDGVTRTEMLRMLAAFGETSPDGQ